MMKETVVDARTMVNLIVESQKKGASFYGPVFARIVAKSAIGFVAKKINDSSPPPVETLEEARDYVLLNIAKYPDGFASFYYGAVVAIKTLEGNLGAGATIATKQNIKELVREPSGKAALNGDSNTTEVLEKYLQRQSSMHVLGSKPSPSGDQNSAIVRNEDCHFSDACSAISSEGIRKVFGGFECPIARGAAAAVEQATGHPHASEMSEFKPPNCAYRVFKV